MQQYVLFFLVILLFSCASQEVSNKPAVLPEISTGTSFHTPAFNISFKIALDGYYELKEEFIRENIPNIDTSADHLIKSIQAILLDSLKADSTIFLTAQTYTEGIQAELHGLLGEKDIIEKRKSFQMVSEQLYDLIRTIQYDGELVYHQFCSMAFDNQGATWLSNSSVIRNPYNSSKLLKCGVLLDSIDFRRKNP